MAFYYLFLLIIVRGTSPMRGPGIVSPENQAGSPSMVYNYTWHVNKGFEVIILLAFIVYPPNLDTWNPGHV